jgi:hypothetical protein
MELPTCHSSCAWNFEVASTVLENTFVRPWLKQALLSATMLSGAMFQGAIFVL